MTDLRTVSLEVLRRAGVVRVYDVGQRLIVLDAQGRGHALEGDSARLARAVLAYLLVGHTRSELYEHLAVLSGAPLGATDVVDELLALLLGAGALERGAPASRVVPLHTPGHRVVLGITGAVAAMNAPVLVQALLERGLVVRVVATREALRFVRVEGLEALTHTAVVADMWPVDSALAVPHIGLAQWADAMLIWPASATTIGRIASGDFSSIVAAVAASTSAPVMLAPSMNPAMSGSAAVQRNLEQLIDDGFHVVHANTGIEVADRPDQRTPTTGGAPSPAIILQLFDAMLRDNPRPRPHDTEDWDNVYRRAPETLAWHHAAADDDLVAIAAAMAAGSRILEVGTGLGVLALACAGLGYRVVATDLSRRAVALARERDSTSAVVWVEDDITDSRLHGSFELMLDRGCAHLLGDDALDGFVRNAARLVAPGGQLVIKALATAAAPGLAVLDGARVRARFGAAFALASEAPSTMPGPSAAPAARLFVLKRHG